MIKRLSWALALSIGLNLFLVGFGVARSWRAHNGPHRPALMHMLGPPTPALRAQHEELMAARKRVGEALEHEPYDRARAEHALEALRASAARGQELLHQRLLERAGQLSPAQRRKLADQRFPGDR
ncbi:MAG: periplasmic heavy metal sensor [Polyangiales bacterium]